MSKEISLQEAEKRVFKSAYDDGMWDILIGSVLLMMVIAPFLSTKLGDFWSSAVSVPFWALVYVVTRLVRRNIVKPRIGEVRFGASRIRKLRKFTLIMLVINIVAFILGLASARYFQDTRWIPSLSLGLILLAGFSLAAYFLDSPRFYLYGLMIVLAVPVGEWLYQNMGFSHHGFPVSFGLTSATIITVGLVKFIQLVRSHPMPPNGLASKEA